MLNALIIDLYDMRTKSIYPAIKGADADCTIDVHLIYSNLIQINIHVQLCHESVLLIILIDWKFWYIIY